MQKVDIPVPGGGLQGCGPRQDSAASSSFSRSQAVLDDADEALEGGFLIEFSEGIDFKRFPSSGRRAGGCAAGWARQLIHAERSSNGSCRSRRALEPIQPRRRLGR